MSNDLNQVLLHGEDEMKAMKDEYVSVEHLFLAMIKHPNKAVKELFRAYGITRDRSYRCYHRSVVDRKSQVTIQRDIRQP